MIALPLNAAPYFEIDTHSPTTLASANADSTPTFTVFKAGNTAVLTDQTFTNRATGEYYATFTASTGNGFAVGDYLIVRSKATVGGITARKSWEFYVVPAEASFGVPAANTTYFGGSAGTFSGGRPETNTTHAAGTAWNSGAIGAATLAANTLTSTKIAADAIGATQLASDAINASKIATGALNASKFAAGAFDAAALATDAAQEIATTLLDLASGVETGFTLRQALRLILAANAGLVSGAATTTETIRDVTNSKNRLVATVDADGNRSAIVIDVS